ncbi:MAG: hypothetical protein O2960_27140 [Verrucomicrobia bacterium]|nr:hypothetical protein [Verrucomicrobiota bacterium]
MCILCTKTALDVQRRLRIDSGILEQLDNRPKRSHDSRTISGTPGFPIWFETEHQTSTYSRNAGKVSGLTDLRQINAANIIARQRRQIVKDMTTASSEFPNRIPSVLRTSLILGLVAVMILGETAVFAQATKATIEFSSAVFFAFENSGQATVNVTRSGDTASAVSVEYTMSSRLATDGADYTAQSGTLAFAPSQTSKTIVIPLFDDAEAEGSEPVDVTLSNPGGGAVLGTRKVARMYIQDNEWRGTLLDNSFSGAIAGSDAVNVLAIQPDGKVLAAGVFARTDSAAPDQIIRLNSDGSRDPSFTMTRGASGGGIFAMEIQPDGKILIGGEFTTVGTSERAGIARLNPDGSLDVSFNPGSGVEGSFSPGVYSIAIQGDGKIFIGGNYESVDGVSRSAIARLQSNGILDATFDPGFGLASADTSFRVPWVSDMKLQADGKIVIVGQFTEVDGWNRVNIARLNSAGTVDPAFDPGTGATGQSASVEAVAIQSDGKIVIGGDFTQVNRVARIALARLNADGSVDLSFDTGSGVMDVGDNGSDVPGYVLQVAVQPDGKILFGGFFFTLDQINRHGIGRVNPNGSLDSTFGPYLGTTYRSQLGNDEFDSVTALALQPDGKILTGATFVRPDGTQENRITRLFSRNVQATTFEFALTGSSVGEYENATTLVVIRRGDSVGNYTVEYATGGGTATSGLDYTPRTGTLSFAPLEVDKELSIPILRDNIMEDDETIKVSLRNPSTGAFLGVLSSFEILIVDSQKPGNLDPSFGEVFVPFSNDPSSFPPVTAIRIQKDNKILVAGYFAFVNDFDRLGMFRLEADGSIDPGFVPEPPTGDFIVEFPQFGLQPDGRIVGGFNRANRLNTNGSLDSNFAPDISALISMAVQNDGSFIVNDEYFDPFTERNVDEIVRFTPDGVFDSSFISAGLNDWATALSIQPDGKVVIGGYFNEMNGSPQNGIARLNANGTPDSSFNVGTGIQAASDPVVFAIAHQPDGKMIVGGAFSGINGVSRNNIARLNANGSVDLTFDPGAGPNGWVETIAVEPSGKIVIGGGFVTANGSPRTGLARLNSDGSLDASFAPKLTFPDEVRVTSIALQANGQILVGGLFDEVNGIFRSGLARINGGEFSPAAPDLKLNAPRFLPGKPFNIVLSTEAGKRYEILYSTDLVNWTPLIAITASSPTLEVEDPNSTGGGSRFYRAVVKLP